MSRTAHIILQERTVTGARLGRIFQVGLFMYSALAIKIYQLVVVVGVASLYMNVHVICVIRS